MLNGVQVRVLSFAQRIVVILNLNARILFKIESQACDKNTQVCEHMSILTP